MTRRRAAAPGVPSLIDHDEAASGGSRPPLPHRSRRGGCRHHTPAELHLPCRHPSLLRPSLTTPSSCRASGVCARPSTKRWAAVKRERVPDGAGDEGAAWGFRGKMVIFSSVGVHSDR
uniref:Uncharacterized protein n=1 Tax=Arundo donax TaxID=35708 RepID=A0A0A8YAN5_ARUDO